MADARFDYYQNILRQINQPISGAVKAKPSVSPQVRAIQAVSPRTQDPAAQAMANYFLNTQSPQAVQPSPQPTLRTAQPVQPQNTEAAQAMANYFLNANAQANQSVPGAFSGYQPQNSSTDMMDLWLGKIDQPPVVPAPQPVGGLMGGGMPEQPITNGGLMDFNYLARLLSTGQSPQNLFPIANMGTRG